MENEQGQEKKIENTEEKNADANSNIGQHEINILEEAKKVNEELKKQNEEKKKLLDREEKLLARQETLRALGGGSPAGQKIEKPVESSKEYAKRIVG